MMGIKHIEVHNFKSYYGTHVIGPFKRFTAIVGPNGSGKSNVMDAITFVLGVAAGKIRAEKLRELINANAAAEGDNEAYVELVYVKEGGSQIAFRRTVRVVGASSSSDPDNAGTTESVYSVRGQVVPKKMYEQHLQSIGIVNRAASFLVPQNEVEAVAQKTPLQLSQYIEEISGSAELAKEYEEAARAAKDAENEFLAIFHQKQSISREHRQARDDAEEAKKFRALLDEFSDLRRETQLFHIYHAEREIAQARTTASRIREELKVKRTEADAKDAALRQHQQRIAQLRRELAHAEKARQEQRQRVSEMRPTKAKLEEELSYLTSKIQTLENEESEMVKEQERRADDIRALENDLASVRSAQAALEAETKTGVQGREMKLKEDQIEEYRRIKQRVDTETAPLREKLEQARRQLALVRERVENDEMQISLQNENKSRLDDTMNNLRARVERLTTLRQDTETALQQEEANLENMETEMKANAARKQELTQKLEEAKQRIVESKVDQAALERASKMMEAIRTLRTLYPGQVKGRLVDLVRPVQAQYQRALEVALGHDMDTIVVEDDDTLHKCMQYLRDQRAGMATFIPLSSIRVQPVNEFLRRSLPPSMKLVYDIVTCDDAHRKAILYALGNTIVCKDLAEARKFAYGGFMQANVNPGEAPSTSVNPTHEYELRPKIVTLDGSVVHRSGNITGGQRSGSQTSRFTEAAMAALQEQTKVWFAELSTLTAASAGTRMEAINRLKHTVDTLRTKLGHIRDDLTNTSAELKRTAERLEALEKSRQTHEAKLQQDRQDLEERSRAVEKLERELDTIVEDSFKSFTRTAKVKSIKEFESNRLAEVQEITERRLKLATHANRLQSQLDYEKSRDVETALKKLRSKLESARESSQKVSQTLTKLQKALDKETEILDRREADVREREAALSAATVESKEVRDAAIEASRILSRLERDVAAAELAESKARQARAEILHKCKLERIDIPLVKRSRAGDEEMQLGQKRSGRHGAGRKRHQRRSVEDGEEEEETDEEELMAANEDNEDLDIESLEQAEISPETSTDYWDKIRVDFSSLSSAAKDPTQVEATKARLAENLATITAALERATPNAHADERLNDVAARLAANQEQFALKNQQQKAAAERFERVKRQRRALFMAAFDAISKHIDPIYKILTSTHGADVPAPDDPSQMGTGASQLSRSMAVGGRAYVTLENHEEPYLHGVIYTATPPLKRFREVTQLSGGEKTMAALAFLFAVHAFRAAPFFVMDEVDAALDSANVERVATYIRSRVDRGLQCIVVSLKDSLYGQADGLIGIYRDNARKSSGVLTFDLRPYQRRDDADTDVTSGGDMNENEESLTNVSNYDRRISVKR